MRIVFRLAILAAYVSLLIASIVIPANDFRFRLYTGQRQDTITQITVIPLHETLSFKRIPFDNLLLFPIKTVKFLDVAFVHSVKANTARPRIKDTRRAKDSLAYCYLPALDRLDISLPVSSNMRKDCVYDVSNYTAMPDFKLTGLSTGLMPDQTYQSFINAFSAKAAEHIYSIKTPEESCIIAIISGEAKRYVYCYRIVEDSLYIVDPENLKNLGSVIENERYAFLTDVWAVSAYYGIAGE